jgi:NitT/TauT family transport system ATP-binding protein
VPIAKLAIENVSKTFTGQNREIVALAGVSLEVGENEFLSLVGTSGCGKSTLLMIVAGLETATSGRVLIDGTEATLPGLDRGVVFQSYTLLPWLTALGNVEFALKAAGLDRVNARKIAGEHLALVGLTDFANAYPVQLSGGMQQRVAIARALAYRPKMLVMDEPFGALDALTRQHMQELLTRIWEHHRLTVLFVTHDVEEAVYMSDRVAVMTNRPGRIKTIVPIDLPRPRTYEMIATAAFAERQRQVLREIRAESLAIAALGETFSIGAS